MRTPLHHVSYECDNYCREPWQWTFLHLREGCGYITTVFFIWRSHCTIVHNDVWEFRLHLREGCGYITTMFFIWRSHCTIVRNDVWEFRLTWSQLASSRSCLNWEYSRRSCENHTFHIITRQTGMNTHHITYTHTHTHTHMYAQTQTHTHTHTCTHKHTHTHTHTRTHAQTPSHVVCITCA